MERLRQVLAPLVLVLVSAGIASAQLPADLTINKTHIGSFVRNSTGNTYTITVSNGAGLLPTTAGDVVTVMDFLPAGLAATGLSGSGWSCTLGTLTCTRSNSLAAGGSYPAITLTVSVAPDAPTPSVTNTATVSYPGEVVTNNNSVNDPTNISNPSPTLNNISPTSAPAGSGQFTLTVNGSNFVSNSVVRWNGGDLATTFVNTGQLTATVTAGLVAAEGSASVTVFNPAPGGNTSGAQTFTIGAALTITTNSLPNGTVGVAYNQSLTASGGQAPYTWAQAGGSLAPLTLNANGTITGTPTTATTLNFTARVTDDLGGTTTKALSITVNAALTITTNSLPNGTVGVVYGQSLAASGGQTPYTWDLASGSVSPLSLNASGNISGTPTSATTLNFTARVTDNGGINTTKALSITIDPAPNPAPTTTSINPSSANAGDPGFTLIVNGTNFVNGVSVVRWNGANRTTQFVNANQLTADIPAADVASAGSATVTVFNPAPGGGTSNGQTFTINQTLNITTTTLPSTTVGASYSQPVNATGGLLVYLWSLAPGSGPLPGGLNQNSATGTISGIPTTAGTFNFTVRVRDALLRTDDQPLTIIVAAAPNISTTTLPSGTVGAAYSQAVSVTGGQGPFTWSISAGSLPNGLTQNTSTGAISGNPTTGGTSNFTARVVDANGVADTQALSITVNNPTPSITSLNPSATTEGAGQFTLTVNGSNFVSGAEVRWAGTSLSTNFVSSTQLTANVPAARVNTAGSFNVTVTNPAPPAGGVTSAPAAFTVNPPLNITTTSLPNGILNALYSQTLQATGGTGSRTWSVVSGSLPSGLSLSAATGEISGTPTSAGTANFRVRVTDSAPFTAATDDQDLSITINNPQPSVLSLNPSSVIAGGGNFTLTVNGAGNSTSFISTSVVRWNGEDLPTTFVGAQQLTAAVSAARIAISGSVSITVFNPGPGGGLSNVVSLEIRNPSDLTITTLTPGSAVAGGPQFVVTIRGMNFVPSSGVRWNGAPVPATFVSPTEMTATIGPALIAVAGTAGVTVVNPPPGGGTSNLATFIINNPVPVLSSISPNGKSAGQETFTLTLAGSNFVAASQVRWNGTVLVSNFVSASELRATVPAALIANPNIATVTVFNPDPGGGVSAARQFTVGNQLLISTETPLPSGTAGQAYSETLHAIGGDPPYRWAIPVGSILPTGLALNPNTGVLSGTPTEIGQFSFSIEVIDSLNVRSGKGFVMNVNPATLLISTNSPLANGTLGSAYAATFAASGGTPPYVNWSVTGGQLPPGLSLNPTNGSLSGTPNTAGAYTFTVTVRDNASNTASKQFTLTVPPPGNVLTILTTSCPAGFLGSGYSCPFTASGGVPAYTWSISQGALPGGLTLNSSSGLLSGTPTATGQFNFTVRVTDSASTTRTQAIALTVGAATVTISIAGEQGPAQQNTVSLSLPQTFAQAVTGQLSLSFTPDASLAVPAGAALDDPAIAFSTGGRTVNFTVPAGGSEANFGGSPLMLQTGTIAGTITVTLTTLRAGNTVITPSPAPSQTIVVQRLSPRISSVRIVNRTATGFGVEVVGYATAREVTQAVFQFTAVPGQTIEGNQATIALTQSAQGWFGSAASVPFGSMFLYTQTFNLSGNISALASVSVTLNNSLGASSALSANF